MDELSKRVRVGPSYIKYYGGGAASSPRHRLHSSSVSSNGSGLEDISFGLIDFISSNGQYPKPFVQVEHTVERLYVESSRQVNSVVHSIVQGKQAERLTSVGVLLVWSSALCLIASIIVLFPQFFVAGLVLGFDQITRGLVSRKAVDQVFVKSLPLVNRRIDTFMLAARALSAVLVCFVGQYIVLQLCVLAVVSTAWIMTRRGMVIVVLLVAIACGSTMTAWLPYWSSVTMQTYAGIASVNLCRQPHATENALRTDSQYRRLLFL